MDWGVVVRTGRLEPRHDEFPARVGSGGHDEAGYFKSFQGQMKKSLGIIPIAFGAVQGNLRADGPRRRTEAFTRTGRKTPPASGFTLCYSLRVLIGESGISYPVGHHLARCRREYLISTFCYLVPSVSEFELFYRPK